MKIFKCLVVDDLPAGVTMLEQYINAHPQLVLVEATTDSGRAIEVIKAQEIDLVFTDLDMPTYSGIDVVQAVEETGRGRAYLITGRATIQRADINSPILVDILEKPVAPNEFIQRLEAFLQAPDVVFPVSDAKTDRRTRFSNIVAIIRAKFHL